MNKTITYGGKWTDQKLEALQNYLKAYLKVFKNHRDWFTLYYIDAFAGPGSWQPKKDSTPPLSHDKNSRQYNLPIDSEIMHDVLAEDKEAEKYKRGSPINALSMPERGFDKFIFVEENEAYLDRLKKQVEENCPEKISKVKFERSDANAAIRRLCNKWDSNKDRAVVFLDPFGMEVEWRTIKAIAQTQAMDLWVMFPLGIGVNRLLTKDGSKIHPAWEKKLDILFGIDDWRNRFYAASPTIFDDDSMLSKTTSLENIAAYFIGRLYSIFAGVVKQPLMLRNSKKNPLFALCFAAGNPRSAKMAVKIATHIIGKER